MKFFKNKHKNTQNVYMDYASTTPLDEKVFFEMKEYFREFFHNPSSIYKEGIKVKEILESKRKELAELLQIKSDEIVFTGSGTESNNLAVLGVFEESRKEVIKPHIIISSIEHPSILEAAREIEERGGEVTYLKVNEKGIINIQDILNSINKRTVLISLMYANNEIGVILPITKISKHINKWKRENNSKYPYIHTDASQAPNYLNCNIDKLGVDLMTLDGSKIYGPKGVGALIKKNGINLKPIMFGGGQENGLRPGTENVPLIIGFVESFKKAVESRESEGERLKELQTYFLNELEKMEGIKLNGDRQNRLPNIVNICVQGLNAEFAVIQFNERGISCASMTACKNLDSESSSYVIKELGKEGCSTSSLRFSMGRYTKKEEIDLILKNLKDIINLHE